MKTNKFSVRLLKPEFSIEKALKKTKLYKDKNGEKGKDLKQIHFETENLGENLNVYIEKLPQYETEPWWKNYLGISKEIKQKFPLSCLLFVTLKDEKRILAFSFGQGHNLLKSESLEDNFGLNVTLNIIDGEKLKSMHISSPADNTKQKFEVSSVLTDVSSYGFSENKDFIEKISGAIKKEYEDMYSSSTGKDSLTVKAKIEKDELVTFSKSLLERFKSDDYTKDEYLKNINKIGKATSDEEYRLFTQLLERLQKKDFDDSIYLLIMIYLKTFILIN